MAECMSDGGEVDMVSKRKERLKRLLGAAHFALGGMAEDAQEQMGDMDMGEDDFLSGEDDSSAIETEDPMAKRKARLFSMIAPKLKK